MASPGGVYVCMCVRACVRVSRGWGLCEQDDSRAIS